MTKLLITISYLSLMATVSVAHADTKSLALEKQCFSCHSSIKQVGKAPAFKAIAERYFGQKNIEASLALRLKNGGVGHWGSTPMPSAEGNRPEVSETEAKELVDWVLAQH